MSPSRPPAASPDRADAPAESLTRALARLLARPVGAEDRARAARHVLDWAGCAVAGAATAQGRGLAGFLPAYGAGPCAVVGRGRTGPPAGAAFLNGGLGNVLEMDDIHRTSILHPGPVVIPAALAAAESQGASAEAFLDAVVRGYEATIRIGESVGPGHYAQWHNTATCGPFGAAVAACGLMGGGEDATVWALGNAGTQAAGPWRMRHERAPSKQLHTARAAEAGLAAGWLAAEGFAGPEFILEGAQGFYAGMAPDPVPEAVTAGPGDRWRIWEVSFKPWPACRHAHPTLDAALALRARGVRAADVAAFRVETYADAVRFCDRPAPETELEAKFSLQHAVAVALSEGAPELAHFTPEAAARADLAALRAKGQVAAAEPYAAAYPRRYGAAVTVRLADGAELTEAAPDALGDPDNPLDEARLIAKAEALCEAGGFAPAQAARLVETALALADPGADAPAAFAAALSDPPKEPR
ncbi:MAG TPA: MmgE/PrpD family protein [Paracoccaceae bacterium]|nr:MmgE/PrpD family protein [Paracoccaceae bacterium]